MGYLGNVMARQADAIVPEREQLQALISEVWMLVDYVAGSPTQGLAKVVVAKPGQAGGTLTPAELLQAISGIERRIVADNKVQPDDRAFVQIVRDALNLAIYPASGLTVAYTAMVTGPLRGRGASRFALAKQAYANLISRALWDRRLQRAILVLALLVTGLAVWESAKVALGKALLQNLDMLHSQQTGLNAEKVKLDLSLAPAAPTVDRLARLTQDLGVPLASYRLCDRPLVLLALATKTDPQTLVQQAPKIPGPRLLSFATAEERDVCGRDDLLRSNLGIVHQDLTQFTQNWPGMVGSGFSVTRNLLHCGGVMCEDSSTLALDESQQDAEFRIAPVILVWGNFVLPIIFSLLGSAIFVLLDHYKKARDGTLHPRDTFLAPVRLALGLVVGACVGLFFSATMPQPPSLAAPSASALISSLTLTASGVAFLAGFGVETVFSLLEALIARVFTVPAAQR